MSMTALDSWALWSVVVKFIALLAVAGVVGGSFVHLLADRLQFALLAHLRGYLLMSAAVGMLMAPLFFLLQVGGVNQQGFSGMWDASMSALLLDSALGQVMVLRLSGFALVLWAVRWLAATQADALRRCAGYLLCAVSALLLCWSFALTGHTATLPVAARMLLVLHVVAVFLWIGALYPLLYLSGSPNISRVLHLMQGFGALALCMVAAIFVAGSYLLTQLLQAPAELVNTSYGLALLLKLAGVGGLLLLAALNKLLLVPRWLVAGAGPLQRSIRFEMAVALYVVAVTSWLTTVTGPAGA